MKLKIKNFIISNDTSPLPLTKEHLQILKLNHISPLSLYPNILGIKIKLKFIINKMEQ